MGVLVPGLTYEYPSLTGTTTTVGMSSPETGLMVQQNAVSRFVRVDDRRVWDFATVDDMIRPDGRA